MSGESIWAVLGIEATGDARAIKRAYSARLKEIDPDTDPQAFIALRAARDGAMRLAVPASAPPRFEAPRPAADGDAIADEIRWPGEPEPVPPSSGSAPVVAVRFGDGAKAPPRPKAGNNQSGGSRAADTAEPEAAAPKPRRTPWQLPTIDDHKHKIESALFAPAGRAAAGDQLKEELAALFRHPDMATIGRADEVETWLAHTIADSIPRSDPLIAPAMIHFGWYEKAKAWECPWHIEEVVQRYHDCHFRDQAAGGEYGPAMKVLRRPAPPRTDFVLAWAVGRFLSYIREFHPSLEYDFDRDDIAWWDQEIERRRRRSWWATLTGLPDDVAAFREELHRG